jgi:hypothetical protein
MNRLTLIPIGAALAMLVSGCGGSSVSSARVAKLEQRVTKLERENATLKNLDRRDVAASRDLRLRLAVLDRRTLANEEALYAGVSAAQFEIACGPGGYQAGCHVPGGSPGAVFKVDGKISANPFP